MKLALHLPANPNEKWILARQIGVRHAITKLHPDLTGAPPPSVFETLLRAKTQFENAGLTIAGLEGDQFDMERIKQGLPGRDEDIETFCQVLRNMGELGIPMLCYNFMPRIRAYRTSATTPERGGALTTAFDYDMVRDAPPIDGITIDAETLWGNFEYFLTRVVPVAEECGVVLALHPDDPPIPVLRGIARIFISPDALRRALSMVPSPSNALTFCQANVKLMGGDLGALIHEFGKAGKIGFVHLRDVEGTAEKFAETFHDNGPTDMAWVLRTYHEAGFDGVLRPDHVPTMHGEKTGVMVAGQAAGRSSAGYETKGRLFAIGYLRGLLEGLGIPNE